MKTGNIILIPFPFAEFNARKVRPCVVVAVTSDKFKDLILCAISSVVPPELNNTEILIFPGKQNNLRTKSIIKVDRIVTLKANDKIANLGKLSEKELEIFKTKFKMLIDS